MANKAASITQTNATRLLKAAKAAGFPFARLTSYPDGRIELVGGDVKPAEQGPPGSYFLQWLDQQ